MTWNGAVMLLFVDLYVVICYILYKEFEYHLGDVIPW